VIDLIVRGWPSGVPSNDPDDDVFADTWARFTLPARSDNGIFVVFQGRQWTRR